MGVEGATSPLNDPGLVLLGAIVSEKKILKEKFITRLLLVRSVRKKYGRRGRDEPFERPRSGSPRCYSVGEKKLLKKNLGSYWSDLDEKNVGVEGATCAFQRHPFGSPRCYNFGEKNSRLLLVRSGRKKCGRRGRDVSFPMIKVRFS
ncbi:hypothetical protein V1477_006413 [Vespula maculifrons]|uniref:Uncharacterized protein n=1 Tax=Vespula maculifrons TaxID=7453 RepID=A0ABD2CKC9_VESMC